MDNRNSFLVLFLAPVREYLEDDSVSEILINGAQQIYIERRGKLEEMPARFVSESALKAAAANIARSVGRLLDEMHPRLDARLPDGSRKIVAVSEVMPLEDGNYRLRDLLAWRTERRTDDGRLEGAFAMENEPSFAAQARQLGLDA